ncbi:uncharacterized protein [Phaenicophaeus curvirostris]|uniref:uncharacterized protein n=1 Tax=Phaenicophaeus curvirostris TaxID=33595 RepID=UPI0037F0CEFE
MKLSPRAQLFFFWLEPEPRATRTMRLQLLLLAALRLLPLGAGAAVGPGGSVRRPRPTGPSVAPGPSPLPAPLGLVVPRDEGPPEIRCLAPRRFAGATFELFAAGAAVAAKSLAAQPDQHAVNFPLDEAAGTSRCLRCRYRRFDGRSWQVSAFSAAIAVDAAGDTGACHVPTAAPTNRPSRRGSRTGNSISATAAPSRQPSTFSHLPRRPWLVPVAAGTAGLVLLVVTVAALATWRGRRRPAGPRRGSPAPIIPMTTAPSPPA